MSKAPPNILQESYPCSAWIYTGAQLLQWISYTAVFSILLDGQPDRSFLAPLYIALLAFFRGIGSLGWVYRNVLDKPWLYYGVFIVGCCLTLPQIHFAVSGVSISFLVLTGIKLGLLAIFHVWRDTYAASVSHRLGFAKSQNINGLFLTVDFATMGLGVFIGGIVASAYGPITTLWIDLALYLVILVVFLVARENPFSIRVDAEQQRPCISGFRPLGVVGHSVRSMSDAGFQGLLPIIAYQVLHVSPAIFGIVVSVSGLLIAIGSWSSKVIGQRALENRRMYGTYCLLTTIGNAIALWLSFRSSTVPWFALWLGMASLLSGIALVTARTIVIAKNDDCKLERAFNVSLHFNAIRWFGIALGGLLLAFMLRPLSLYPLAIAFLSGMALSGILFWLDTVFISQKPHYIGQQIQRLLLLTIAVLCLVVCTIIYFAFYKLPQARRCEARHYSLQPYITLLKMNFMIPDMSESMRLTRQFKYPNGVTGVRIASAVDDQLIFEERFVDALTNVAQGKLWKNRFFADYTLQVYEGAFFSKVYRYIYALPDVGPRGDDVSVAVIVDDTPFVRSDFWRFALLSALAVGFLSVVYQLLKNSVAMFHRPLGDVSRHLQVLSKDESLGSQISICPMTLAGQSLEIRDVVCGYNSLLEKLDAAYGRFAEVEAAEKVRKVASQVAHDIKSPLVALSVVSMHLEELSEDKRIMIRNAIQRISDIANDLATRQSQSSSDETSPENGKEKSVQLLSSLIELLISEKRTQFRSRLQVQIQSMLSVSSYGLFAQVQPVEFKRILSNLINNAVEAMPEKGTVTVSLAQNDTQANIVIRDSGQGIPADILPRLMQKGATFNKEGGSGLGLYHAKTTIAAWNGTIAIESETGLGTTVTITLPCAPPPAWFVPSVELAAETIVVIVDDDTSIHQIWDDRFTTVDTNTHGIVVKHFSSSAAVVQWHAQERNQSALLFLCDYELLGESQSGLDLIEHLNIADQAILVTSRYEEEPVQKRCADIGVRLIPKNLAGHVPIRVATHRESTDNTTNKARPNVLVIDDDANIHIAWKVLREQLGVGVLAAFESMECCEASRPVYDTYDFAFVDKNILGSTWSAHQAITYLKHAGVKKVYLASGEDVTALVADNACQNADGIVRGKIPETLYSAKDIVPLSNGRMGNCNADSLSIAATGHRWTR